MKYLIIIIEKGKSNKINNFYASIFEQDVNLENLKNNFAYYNNQSFIEIPRALEEKCEKYVNHFVDFGNLQTMVVTEVIHQT